MKSSLNCSNPNSSTGQVPTRQLFSEEPVPTGSPTCSKTKILGNERIAARSYKMKLSAAAIAKIARPGQFVMVRCADGSPLLRRPFSIHRVSGLAGERVSGLIEILYEVVGSGTEILAQKKPGEWLDIIGPLGNGFDLNPLTGKPANRQTILIAGGIGVVPLVFLAEKLRNKKGSGPFLKPIVLIGAKTKSEILCEKEFKALGCNVRIATDDGTKGHKGFVTELLKKILGNSETQRSRGQVIYACGPQAMLKETAKIAVQHGLQCQVSLETHMACGIGACLGCVVNTKEGYRRVCKEGPVVDGSQIIW